MKPALPIDAPLMPRSLGARLVAAFAIFALAILFAVGGTLFVVLRDLHQGATLNGLSGVAGSVLPQVRDAIGTGQLRGTVLEVRDQLAAEGIELLLIGADGRLKPFAGDAVGPVILDADALPGQQLSGVVVLDDGRYLYVATALRRVGAAGPRAVAFLERDRSGAEALADVGRAIPIVVIAILLIATPLALAVSRSVTRPLRRLADATTDIPAGRAPELPIQGPAEVRELTGTFNAMAAELESTRERESQLLANLQHDLRTPLTVIGGFAAALRDGTASGEAADKAARAIEEEANRLDRLVAQIGAVERIGSGEEPIRPEMLDARLLVAETVARFAARAAAAGVDLALADSTLDPLPLAADRLAVERMLGNLVENAIAAASQDRAGRRRTGTVRIAAEVERSPGGVESVRIDVLDDGPGFPDGGASHAFERFWRGDPARAGTGSGLGLAIVRELAVAHGGTAHAGNRSPRGARAGVVLPRVPWSPGTRSASPLSS
jgi:signal transduction histidine kinase